jgi:Putative peptidoglycan binding domain
MGMERPPDRPPEDGPREDDWLQEDWLEAPTEETPPPSRGRRPTTPSQLKRPDRRVVALVAVAALVLIIVLAVALGGDGDDEAGQTTTPTATDIETSETTPTEAGPTEEVPEGEALAEGDSGRRVRRLQRALATLGYDVTPDGQYGPATTEAVSAFQEDAGLDADGVAGSETVAAINEALANRG